MNMFRRAGPWVASVAIHAGLAVAAFLAVAGIVRPAAAPDPDVTYTVALRPGGGPSIGDARPADPSTHGTPSKVVIMEDVPLSGVPDLPLKSSITQLPAAGGSTGGTPGRVYERGPVAKFPSSGNGGGSSTLGGAGTGSGSGVGEGTDAGVEAVALETPSPVYPEEARRGQLQGTVIAEIRIDRGGNVESARATSGSGSKVLDEAALAAVRTWKYRPATLNGHPTPSVRRVRFVFRLE